VSTSVVRLFFRTSSSSRAASPEENNALQPIPLVIQKGDQFSFLPIALRKKVSNCPLLLLLILKANELCFVPLVVLGREVGQRSIENTILSLPR
jgi:hypothetical protein